MNEPDHRADGELLAAYLDDDLDDDAVAALEARLRAEPALAARLDATARSVALLQGLDEVEPPEGYAERLRERLAAERSVATLRPQRRRAAWGVLGGLAAAFAALAIVGGGIAVRGGGEAGLVAEGGGEDLAAESAEDDTSGEAFGEDEESAAAGADAAAQAEDAPAAAAAPVPEQQRAAPPDEPVVVDQGVALADEAAVRDHLGDLPEVQALLGLPVDEAAALAERYRVVLQRAPAFQNGVAPAACLDAVTAGDEAPLVPARVEALRYAGEPALAYVLVRSADGALLDRAEVWIVGLDCSTRLFASL
jgi:hypothetical protein